jgi:5-methylcytosine-specific restriction endonuclease McrA
MRDDPNYLKNREKRIQQVKAWTEKNKDRVRSNKRNHAKRRAFWALCKASNCRYEDRLTPWDLWKIAHRQKMVCPLTGEKLTRDNISVDHIVPRSKGGKNVPSNVRLTTKEINWFKRTMTDEELLVMCRTVVSHMSNNKSTFFNV